MQYVHNLAIAVGKTTILQYNRQNMIANRRKSWVAESKKLKGVICMKVSNISCFFDYIIDPVAKTCSLKVYCRFRPGFITMNLKDIDVATFDIKKEISLMKMSVKAAWNKTGATAPHSSR